MREEESAFRSQLHRSDPVRLIYCSYCGSAQEPQSWPRPHCAGRCTNPQQKGRPCPRELSIREKTRDGHRWTGSAKKQWDSRGPHDRQLIHPFLKNSFDSSATFLGRVRFPSLGFCHVIPGYLVAKQGCDVLEHTALPMLRHQSCSLLREEEDSQYHAAI